MKKFASMLLTITLLLSLCSIASADETVTPKYNEILRAYAFTRSSNGELMELETVDSEEVHRIKSSEYVPTYEELFGNPHLYFPGGDYKGTAYLHEVFAIDLSNVEDPYIQLICEFDTPYTLNDDGMYDVTVVYRPAGSDSTCITTPMSINDDLFVMISTESVSEAESKTILVFIFGKTPFVKPE